MWVFLSYAIEFTLFALMVTIFLQCIYIVFNMLTYCIGRFTDAALILKEPAVPRFPYINFSDSTQKYLLSWKSISLFYSYI